MHTKSKYNEITI